jgi:hypothetical protein
MRAKIRSIAVAFATVFISSLGFALPAAAQASCQVIDRTAEAFSWTHLGGNPYADRHSEAFSDEKLDRFLACNNVPEADWEAIKRQVRENQGEQSILRRGDVLATMMTRTSMIRNVAVGIENVPALRWEITVNGHRYVLVLPLECWNWSMAPAILPECAVVMVSVEAGDTVRVVVSAEGSLPSPCWAARESGSGLWLSWPGRCDDCSWVRAHSAVPNWQARELRQPGRWRASTSIQELRVPRVVAERDYLGICVERGGRHSNTIWVTSSDWQKPAYRFTFTDPWTW